MKILKFGGTSVGEVYAIKQLCYILNNKKKQEDRYAIIVSAIGEITNKLVNCAKFAEKKNYKYYLILDEIEIKHLEIIQELFTFIYKINMIRHIIIYINNLENIFNSIYTITYISNISLNKIMNFGELISSYLINEKLKENKYHSVLKDSRELFVTNFQCENLQINIIKSVFKIKGFLIKENATYIIIPGFISSFTEKETYSLGRGGSDYSASLLSSIIQTEYIEIWTDVSGILTLNPNIKSKVFPMEKLSYKESIELSRFGTNIIYTPTLLPSIKKNIPIMIRNTFSPLERGTFIFSNLKGKRDKSLAKGITCIEKQILRKYNIDKELCIFTIIINYMKNIPVTLGRMFFALGNKHINIYGIGYIGKNISTVIEKKNKKFIKTLHYLFFEKKYKNIHIFIAGLGKVGSKLIDQLKNQKEYLIEKLDLKIKVIGICNSKRMYFYIKGVNLTNWKDNIKLGINMTIEKFIVSLYKLNLHNMIFVDNTASKEIANIYDDLLVKGIGVVTSNKVTCASSYQEYKNIKNLARYFKTPFFFETNVGAGLPIIDTINYLKKSGDNIHLIDAVLSGSLNFIFNKCKGLFTESVSEAKNIGLSEPDIRLDLSGIDVIRKILILVRECGDSIELEDIKQMSLLPKSCLKAYTEEEFYQELFYNEYFFTQVRLVPKEQKKKIRFIAKYKYGEVYVKLEHIEFEHPFYQLDGKDNIIQYTTERYAYQPLLIKGAGAGAEVTASGVFSDLIKASMCI